MGANNEKINKKPGDKEVVNEAKKENSPPSEEESNKNLGKLHTMEEENDSKEGDLHSKLDHYISLTEQLKKESEENHQQLLRARADLENFRRRSRKETEDMVKYAPLSLIESLLPVLDNFERALDAADTSKETKALYDGVEMVYRQLQNALSSAGLSLIEAKGNAFDPHQHNAVMQEETEGVEPGIVIEELQTGYRFMDRVVRPTMVKISK